MREAGIKRVSLVVFNLKFYPEVDIVRLHKRIRAVQISVPKIRLPNDQSHCRNTRHLNFWIEALIFFGRFEMYAKAFSLALCASILCANPTLADPYPISDAADLYGAWANPSKGCGDRFLVFGDGGQIAIVELSEDSARMFGSYRYSGLDAVSGKELWNVALGDSSGQGEIIKNGELVRLIFQREIVLMKCPDAPAVDFAEARLAGFSVPASGHSDQPESASGGSDILSGLINGISSMFSGSGASQLVGQWGMIMPAQQTPTCSHRGTIEFSWVGDDLRMQSSTGTALYNRVESISNGWELYADGNPNAMVVRQVSSEEITLNLGPILGEKRFGRCD